jgi:hypothetical protein
MASSFPQVFTTASTKVLLFALLFQYCPGAKAQSFSIGFNIAAQMETTNYGGQHITGVKTQQVFTFEDSVLKEFQRQSFGGGISFIRTLPKHAFLLVDVNMALYTTGVDFSFLEYDTLGFSYEGTSACANILLQKYFGKLHVGIGYRPFLVCSEGVYGGVEGANMVPEFEGTLFRKSPYLKSFIHAELGFKWYLSPFVAFNYGLSKKQNFISKNELYFDFGFRVFLDLETKLGKYKLFKSAE